MKVDIVPLCVLSLIVHRTEAFLPYSIPDLGPYPYVARDVIPLPTSANYPARFLLASSLSPTGSSSRQSLATTSHIWTGESRFPTGSQPSSQSGTAATTSQSSSAHTWTEEAPYPFPSNSSSTARATITGSGSGFRSSAYVTSPSPSGYSSFSSTTPSSPPSSTTLSEAPSSGTTSASTEAARTSASGTSSTLVDNEPIIVTTVTASDGSPSIVTITTTAPIMSDPEPIVTVTETQLPPNQGGLPSSLAGQPVQPTQPAQDTPGLGGFPSIIPEQPPQPQPSSLPGGTPVNPPFPSTKPEQPDQPQPSQPGDIPASGPGGLPTAGPGQSSQPQPSQPGDTPSAFPIPSSNPEQPSQPSDVPTDPPADTKGPPLYIFDAVIDGESYHLPSPDQPPIVILLRDGSLGELSSGKVVLRGETLNIPPGLSSVQEISSGGQTIKAQPGESTDPSSGNGGEGGGDDGDGDGEGGDGGDGGDGGGCGLFALVCGAVDAVGDAAGGIADVGKGAMDFATSAGGAAAGGLAGGLAGTFGSALKGVDGVTSTLNGLQKALPLDQLSQAGLGAFTGAQNLGRDAANWMKSMGKMVEGFDALPSNVQQQVKDNIKDYAGEGGQLERAGEAMRSFSEFPWEQEAPPTQSPSASATQPPQTDIPEPTKTQATDNASATVAPSSQGPEATTPSASTHASSTTTAAAEATAGEELTTYFIQTREGTSLETFNNFIGELDGATGKSWTYDAKLVDHQNYKTQLNPSQAAKVEKLDFVLTIFPCIAYPSYLEAREEYRAIDHHHTLLNEGESTSRPSPGLRRRAMVDFSSNAPYWKQMMAQEPAPFKDRVLPRFLSDESRGRGTTIYVLDDGFDLTIPDLAAKDRTVSSFILTNDDYFPSGWQASVNRHPNARQLDPAVSHGFHGTKMAAIAGGRDHGVAPNADLYLLKTKNQYNLGAESSRDANYALMPAALSLVLNEVQRHIGERAEADPKAKSVINMSWGVLDSERSGPALAPLLSAFINWCDRSKIPVVVAAGNDNFDSLHEKVPQKFGTDTNSVITVGGVQKDGSLWPQTSPHQPGQLGSMTVFAPAVDVVAPGAENVIDDQVILNTGTSQAAAIVSGLAAYFYSLPLTEFHDNPDVPLPREDVKQFIKLHAYRRAPLMNPPPPNWPPVTSVDVVYNLANGDTAHGDRQCVFKRANESFAGCNLSSTAPSATSAGPPKGTATSSTLSSATLPGDSQASGPATVTVTVTPSQTSIPSGVPTSVPTSTQCRLAVKEVDDANSTIQGNQTWVLDIYSVKDTVLDNGFPFCHHGKTADEREGSDIKCPHLGASPLDTISVQREDGNGLRFIWGDQTWSADEDERCRLAVDWHPNPEEGKRERTTECIFDCTIDESKKPAWAID